MATITKDTIIGDILDIAPETAPVFLSIGMHCLGCPSSRGETVEQACMVHGVDVDALLEKINALVPAANGCSIKRSGSCRSVFLCVKTNSERGEEGAAH